MTNSQIILLIAAAWILIAAIVSLVVGRLFHVINRGNVIIIGRAISEPKSIAIRGILRQDDAQLSKNGIGNVPSCSAPPAPPAQIPAVHRELAKIAADVLREYRRN